MELRELISIFTLQRKFFVFLFLIPFFFCALYLGSLDTTYKTHMTVLVSRTTNGTEAPDTQAAKQQPQQLIKPLSQLSLEQIGAPSAQQQGTVDDEYSSYYRLSADEKFALTITEWLSAPSVAQSILQGAANSGEVSMSIDDLSGFFQTSSNSPHIVNVVFNTDSQKIAQDITSSVEESLSALTARIGQVSGESSWFDVRVSNIATKIIQPNTYLLLIMATVAGFALAIMGTLFRHYMRIT